MDAKMTTKADSSETSDEGVSTTFERLAGPHRREIKLHCYRMLGSLHEADDLVQETYLRAWRHFDGFDGNGSFRAWLYKIATNACLNALESRRSAQRFMPDQLGAAHRGLTREMPGDPASDKAWLEPYPNTDLHGIADEAPTPEARYASREAVQLAFVAAIQVLPPRQRAALLLCDVLGWSAVEAASLLGGSTAAINSLMQRARELLSKRHPDGYSRMPVLTESAQQELLQRYLTAWEGHDVDGFVGLLKEDAEVTMPPWLLWFIGRDAVRSFFSTAWKTCGGLRLVSTAANGQPAFGAYELNRTTGKWEANAIHVLTLDDGGISAVTLFLNPCLFPAFGLPNELGAAPHSDSHGGGSDVAELGYVTGPNDPFPSATASSIKGGTGRLARWSD